MRTLATKALVTFGDGRVFAGDTARQATSEERELVAAYQRESVTKSLEALPDENACFDELLGGWLGCSAMIVEKAADTEESESEEPEEQEPSSDDSTEPVAANPFIAALSGDSLYYFAFTYLQPSPNGKAVASHCLAKSQEEAELKAKAFLAGIGLTQDVAVRRVAVATIVALKQKRLWETLNILECTEVIANELLATQQLTAHIESVSKSIRQQGSIISAASMESLFGRSESWEQGECTQVHSARSDANKCLDSLFPF